MKTFKITFIAVITAIMLSSCADNKTIHGKTYRPYGIFNENSCKNDSIYYEVSPFAAVSGVIFAEILFIPTVYTYGYNLWEPICLKSELNNNDKKGVINGN